MRRLSILLLPLFVFGCSGGDDDTVVPGACDGDPCFADVVCTPTSDGYACGACPAGLEGDGETCTDPDGCADDPCFTGVSCADVPAPGTGFTCGDCPAGLEGDGATCTDVDGCAAAPCFADVICTDVAAPDDGYTCGDCPAGYEGDGETCTDVDGCVGAPCFAGVMCTDVAAPGTGFTCGACPPGLEGDGVTCTEIDGCAGEPCLAGTTCTDIAAPGVGFTCTQCEGPDCPILRALAGPDQEIVRGTVATLTGDAVGYNGAFSCAWTNDRDASTMLTCSATVAPTVDTLYTLTVTDASGLTATDGVAVRLVAFSASAGPDRNIAGTQTATLTATWVGASCADDRCIRCLWQTSTSSVVGTTCTVRVSPPATAQYFVTVTDTNTGESDTDSASVYRTDALAELCGWDVVVLTSDEYPTAPNPNYICDGSTARRQTVNGKPAIVLSDLVVQNVRIVGHIGVETTGDDDLIGFLWGWQNPAHAYLLSWKQFNQSWTARCGNALAGIAVKKIDGAVGSSTTVTFNPSFGFNASDYVYNCADLWSTDRNNASLLSGSSIYLESPRDPMGVTRGWSDRITYRFEFFYTPTRTRIVVYEDDLMSGATEEVVASLDVVDSSYPEGAFAFFSNSQAEVAFGDFLLASLDDFAARAGADRTVAAGTAVMLQGAADLAVPPYLCEWSVGPVLVSSDCAYLATPSATTTYELTVTDDFGRVATDEVVVTVAP